MGALRMSLSVDVDSLTNTRQHRYSGASSPTGGGGVTGDGGIHLIKILSHDGASPIHPRRVLA